MYLWLYIVAFVTSEGGEMGTTRRLSCLHKGVWVPDVCYLTYIILTCNQSAIVKAQLCWIASTYNPVCHIVGTYYIYNIYTIIMLTYNCL